MLKSLKIQNFKNIKDIHISSLSKINLITGKNNTSKTTLLEAIGVLASNFDFSWIDKIIKDRDESFINTAVDKEYGNLKTLRSLFYNRIISLTGENAIFIGDAESENFINLQFVSYIEESLEQINPKTNEKYVFGKHIKKIESTDNFHQALIGLEVRFMDVATILPIDESRSFFNSLSLLFRQPIARGINFQFIKPSFQENEINGILWDKITLSEKEDYVIDILRIIDPDLEKIAFIKDEGQSAGRRVTAKIRGMSERVPLKAMGDGINRVLSIALGLVNSDNGYLLIDEFENGLHYSVQKKLWEVIFKIASLLNIQVFATTHSEDCIAAFSEVVNLEEHKAAGKLFRLEKKDKEISVVEYDSKELLIAAKNQIETR